LLLTTIAFVPGKLLAKHLRNCVVVVVYLGFQ